MGYRLFLAGLLIAAAGYVVSARQIHMDPWTAAELVNAQTLPTGYGIVLGIALIWLLIRGRPATTPPETGRLVRVAGIIVLTLAFTALLGFADLWLLLGALIALTSLWLGERRWLPLLGVSLTVPLIGYLGIEVLLGLYLPD